VISYFVLFGLDSYLFIFKLKVLAYACINLSGVKVT